MALLRTSQNPEKEEAENPKMRWRAAPTVKPEGTSNMENGKQDTLATASPTF